MAVSCLHAAAPVAAIKRVLLDDRRNLPGSYGLRWKRHTPSQRSGERDRLRSGAVGIVGEARNLNPQSALRAQIEQFGEVGIGQIVLCSLTRGESVALDQVDASKLRAVLRETRCPPRGGGISGGGTGGAERAR